ncbi:glypican-6 [Epargyreus clarus]|uniref:glypican-6 n=1 Tax=Epargyreus clarus TaxID=520877 RepID=UPI003C2B36BE
MAVNVCCCVKLSPNKKSIFGLSMRSQILYFVLFASFLAVVSAADTEISCASVQSIFEKKGMLSAVDIQALPNSDAGELCSNRGCCGANARGKLTQLARTQLESSLRGELSKLADILANRARRFDEFFRKLLQLSREEFHAMFKRTYGIIYEQHSYVFEQLFEQLERYYTRGDTNFDEMMDSFFSILYQKMFTVLNSQYNFDEKYLKCVSEHMRDIQPFEDVPAKLSVQLRRAFVATRTFHKALRSGADVVKSMMLVGVSQECVTAWARLRYCGTCAGEQPPACSRYCHNVIRGCLPTHADLSEQWDAYVDAVEKVADRLLGPFNIAMVVEPIDIKISEAIMSFQERNQEISQKIFSGCGKPDLGGGGGAGPFFAPDRARRFARAIPDFDWYHKNNDVDDFEIVTSFENLYSTDASLLSLRSEGIRKATEELAEQAKSRDRFLQYMRDKMSLVDFEEHERRKRDAEPEPAPGGGEIGFRAYEFDGKRGSKKKKPAATAKTEDGHGAESGPALERLVRETRARVRGSRRYWAALPAVLCTAVSVTTAPCFNGTHVASYTAIAAGDGSAALASNPEVRAPPAAAARAPLDALRGLTARLKDAYNGVEVQWKDSADDQQLAAASQMDFVDTAGSGSGSGDDLDDTEDLPDDDEDKDNGNDYPEGSGDSRPIESDRTISNTMSNGPPVPELPIDTPNIDGPITNVQTRVNTDEPLPTDIEPPVDTTSDRSGGQDTPVEHPASAAERPSLHKALFTYALPVVCAWFGTIVTDLF